MYFRPAKPLLMIVLTSILLHLSSQNYQNFQSRSLPHPFPSMSVQFFSATTFRAAVIVRGATQYHHLTFLDDRSGKSKDDTSLYRTDDYTHPSTVSGKTFSYVYVVSAPGLVSIQMAIFGNGKKVLQSIFVAAQFDRGYTFTEFRTNQACKLKFSVLTYQGNFNIFQNKNDAFSQSLPAYTFDTSQIILPKAGKYYLRISYSSSTDISGSGIDSLTITTPSDNACSNFCPSSRFPSLLQTTKNLCICTHQDQIYNPQTDQCQHCAGSSLSVCTDLRPQICHNQFKQGTQQCDNGDEIGCTNCRIDPGYRCTQNQQGKSICELPSNTPTPTPTPDSPKEIDTSIQTRNNIIIGTTVGIGGGGLAIGLATYFILKCLKAKSAVAQTANSSAAVLV